MKYLLHTIWKDGQENDLEFRTPQLRALHMDNMKTVMGNRISTMVTSEKEDEVIHIHSVYPEHCGSTNGILHTNHKDVTCPKCKKNMEASGDTMNFSFPRTKFVDENGLVGQILHMGSEQLEAEESMLTPDIDHTAEEIMDKYHSCETALRILAEKYGINLNELRRRVERKNFDRGYYS